MVIVKLDRDNYGAGPGVVLEVLPKGASWRERYEDRDGALPSDLRLWVGYEGVKVGDRVETKQYD